MLPIGHNTGMTNTDQHDPLDDNRPPGAHSKEGTPDIGRDAPYDEEPEGPSSGSTEETPDNEAGDRDPQQDQEENAPGLWVADPDSGPPVEPNEPG